ncbi:DUF6255 family natural product biosynthesis protein [Streptomyces luteireticuli]|uniref:DUF6255 family natural product biosynthesis protein n=1 Tax=Streptomyces luteireticuli TaxID=173858 RepID=UPI00355754F6
MRAVGRLISHCPHRSGWEPGEGEARCRDCGTRRFTDYRALRTPERPTATTSTASPPRDRARADRSAAILISRGLHNLCRWGSSNRMWRLAV